MSKAFFKHPLRTWPLACLVLACLLLTAGRVEATITVLNYWHLGENDPGAVSGGQCTITTDTGGHTLTNSPLSGPYPTYTNGVSLAASAETGSSLGLAFTNKEYLVGNVATSAVDNFGIECWVNTGTNAGSHVLAHNGLRDNGWGLYQSGTTYEVLYGGIIFFGSASAPMNTWVHLALVRNNGVAILYTNGVPASTNTVRAPSTPTGSFTVGGDANFSEFFVGAIDEVRVFTFAPGGFSTNDLLLNSTNLLVVNANDAGPGSLRNAIAYAPSGSAITFTNTLSGATILLTSGQLMLNQSVTIDASTLVKGIQINGLASSPILLVNSGTVLLNSLTVTNGYDQSGIYAGGIYNQTTLTMANCTIAGNVDVDGGGGIFTYGPLTLNDCTLADNNGGDGNGGGILNENTLTVNNCTLANNSSDNGGGIYNIGTLNLTNSIVCSNTAPSNPDIAGSYQAANTLVSLNAQLAPLGNYGGPTMTMPPYAGSPAIEAGSDAVTSFLATDQRGHPRRSGVHVDIGAVEVDTNSIVTLNSDTGAAGTLRYAVAHIQANDLVSFAQNLSGATIVLSGASISLNQSVTIDASTLVKGIQINGLASSPILLVNSGTVLLNSLTVTNGYDQSGIYAGGIYNQTTLTMANCTIAGNVDVDGGGGIFTYGPLTLNDCTLADNNGGDGNGGGILNENTLTVNNCTLANNSSDNGGGIYNIGTLNLTNSIVCSNTAPSNPDIAGSYQAANTLVSLNAQLAPLGNYGGPTMTMPPTNGSPAIDAGGTTTLTTDQRGYPRPSGLGPDIGAVEVQYASSTNPPVLKAAMWTSAGRTNSFTFSFTYQPTVTFSVLAGTNLAAPLNTWTNLGPVVETPAFSGQFPFTDTQATNFPKRFYRVTSP